MIVKCEQCQTRFKIPDDKVTDKGVKVRCTKCQHTFRVRRSDAPVGQTISAAPPSADPFARFGVPADPAFTETTRPAVAALGSEGRSLDPSYAAQRDLPPEVFEAETRVRAIPPPPPGRRPLTDPAPAPQQFGTNEVTSPNGQPLPFDFSEPTAGSAPGPFDFDGPPVPAASHGGYQPAPFDFSALDAPPEPTQPAAKPMPRAAPPPPAPSQFEPTPFDFSALGDAPPAFSQEPAPAPPPQPQRPSAFDPPAFDFGAIDSPPAPAARQPVSSSGAKAQARPPAASPPSRPRPPAASPPAFDFGTETAPPPVPRASPAATVPSMPAVQPPAGSGGLLGDLSDLDDPFGGKAVPAAAMEVDVNMLVDPDDRKALFDMSDVPPPPPEPVAVKEQPLELANQPVPVAKVALRKVTAEELAIAEEKPKLTARRVIGVVANTVSAAVILLVVASVTAIFINDGKLDATSFRWERLKAVFSTPRELTAFDISNGLYDTKGGRPVFFVRGEVKNRSEKSGKAKVRAEILDGESLVRSAEAWVGANPSPEDLFGIVSPDDLEKLHQKLSASAVQLSPGEQAPFLVMFYEYPPELKGYRVKVTVQAENSPTAAR